MSYHESNGGVRHAVALFFSVFDFMQRYVSRNHHSVHFHPVVYVNNAVDMVV